MPTQRIVGDFTSQLIIATWHVIIVTWHVVRYCSIVVQANQIMSILYR